MDTNEKSNLPLIIGAGVVAAAIGYMMFSAKPAGAATLPAKTPPAKPPVKTPPVRPPLGSPPVVPPPGTPPVVTPRPPGDPLVRDAGGKVVDATKKLGVAVLKPLIDLLPSDDEMTAEPSVEFPRDYVKGSVDPRVKNIQYTLNRLGAYPKLVEDGKWGTNTANAVKAFQAKHSELADERSRSVFGPMTSSALEYEKSKLSAEKSKSRDATDIDYIRAATSEEDYRKRLTETNDKRRAAGLPPVS